MMDGRIERWNNEWKDEMMDGRSHHETSLKKLSLRAMPAPASKMEERLQVLKSLETTCREMEVVREMMIKEEKVSGRLG